MFDAYTVLGISRSADPDAIRQAWRQRIRTWHPDRHGSSPESLEQTKRINAAYQAILRERARAGPFLQNEPPPPPTPPVGELLTAKLRVPWEIALRGGKFAVTFHLGTHGTRHLDLTIPAGCPIGKAWRRPGLGGAGTSRAGDLVIQVAEHVGAGPWRIKGRDVLMNLEVSLYHFYTRQPVRVASPWGPLWTHVDDTTPNPLRFAGAGVRTKARAGDLVVAWKLSLPPPGDPLLTLALERLQGTTNT